MEAGTTSTTMTAKPPILNPGDYDLWLMRIEQYFLMTDYSLWEVIKNGNKVLKRTVGETKQEYELTTAEEKQDRRNEMKARGTLLMALPNKDKLKFHSYNDAKLLMEAIEKRLQKLITQLEIQGEVITQEDMNLKLLRSLPSEWKTHALIWRTYQAKEEYSTNFALMAHTSSRSSSSSNFEERISKKRTKNEVKTKKPDTEWKSVEKMVVGMESVKTAGEGCEIDVLKRDGIEGCVFKIVNAARYMLVLMSLEVSTVTRVSTARERHMVYKLRVDFVLTVVLLRRSTQGLLKDFMFTVVKLLEVCSRITYSNLKRNKFGEFLIVLGQCSVSHLDEDFVKRLRKIEFFKKKQLDISELNKESGEKQNLFENETSVFQIKIDELEKSLEKQIKENSDLLIKINNLENVFADEEKRATLGKLNAFNNENCNFESKAIHLGKIIAQKSKDFDDVNLELSNRTSKFEAYFENLKKRKLFLNDNWLLLKQIASLESQLASQDIRSCQKEYHELRTSYNALKVKFDSLNRKKWNINVSKSSKPKESVSEKVHTGESSKWKDMLVFKIVNAARYMLVLMSLEVSTVRRVSAARERHMVYKLRVDFVLTVVLLRRSTQGLLKDFMFTVVKLLEVCSRITYSNLKRNKFGEFLIVLGQVHFGLRNFVKRLRFIYTLKNLEYEFGVMGSYNDIISTRKIEFFKKKQLDISELNKESGEKQNLFENETSVFQIKIDELEKSLEKQIKENSDLLIKINNLENVFADEEKRE
ncbi:hypothetical protein Tco_0673133 [Tanacetum coccineum]